MVCCCCWTDSATFEGRLEEQAQLMREIGKYVDAVVIITNQICDMDEVCYTLQTLLGKLFSDFSV